MKENDLILMLNNEFNEIKTNLSSLTKQIVTYNNWINICDIIVGNAANNVSENPNYIVEINLDEMFQNLEFNDSDLLKKLRVYQRLAKNESYPINDEQKVDVVRIFKLVREFVLEKLRPCFERESKLKTRSELLENVIEQLSNNKLDKDGYDFLYQYLTSNGEDIDGKLDLLIALSLKLNASFDLALSSDDVEDDLDEVHTNNLNLDKVIGIFNKYGYDFRHISNEAIAKVSPKIDEKTVSPQEYILRFGDYDNLAGILKVLSENNIQLDFGKYSNQLCRILTLSTKDNVCNIINNIKEDLTNHPELSFNEVFHKFIKSPSIFVSGKKYCGTLRPKSDGFNGSKDKNDNNVFTGNYHNYVENRKLFIDLGVDIILSLNDCFSVFYVKNSTARRNIDTLELYGITKNEYIKSLSCLASDTSKIASIIDKFIELGSFNIGLSGYRYVKNNLSIFRTVIKDCDALLYRLINATNNGYGIDDLFHTTYKGTKYMSLCTKFLNDFRSDVIYERGQEVILKTFETANTALEGLDLDVIDLPFHPHLFSNYFVRQLENFKESELHYNFNGVYISRNKVLRNINALLKNKRLNGHTIMYALTKDSILTKTQYQEIFNCVNYILYREPLVDKGVNVK